MISSLFEAIRYVYRSFCASWTTKTVGAMWTT